MCTEIARYKVDYQREIERERETNNKTRNPSSIKKQRTSSGTDSFYFFLNSHSLVETLASPSLFVGKHRITRKFLSNNRGRKDKIEIIGPEREIIICVKKKELDGHGGFIDFTIVLIHLYACHVYHLHICV